MELGKADFAVFILIESFEEKLAIRAALSGRTAVASVPGRIFLAQNSVAIGIHAVKESPLHLFTELLHPRLAGEFFETDGTVSQPLGRALAVHGLGWFEFIALDDAIAVLVQPLEKGAALLGIRAFQPWIGCKLLFVNFMIFVGIESGKELLRKFGLSFTPLTLVFGLAFGLGENTSRRAGEKGQEGQTPFHCAT